MKSLHFRALWVMLLLVAVQFNFAQTNKKIQKLLNKKDYTGAIKEYEKEYNDKGNKTAAVRIGDLYYRLDNYKEAYYWYNREISQMKKNNQSIYKYAETCRILGEYQKALDSYILYAIETNKPDEVVEKTQQCEALLKAESLSYLYQEELLPFNTANDETNMCILRNNPIMATNNGTKKIEQYDLLMFVREHEKWLAPVPVQKELPENISRTAVSYTQDGNKVAYCVIDNMKEYTKNNKPLAKLFFATNLGNKWLNTTEFPYNSDKYACNYPCLNGDGTLMIFASDMPGGMGGYDLYVSEWDGSNWKEPKNLGPLVNTKDDEIAPYLVKEGDETFMYFSTNHAGGFGGFDIYKSQVIDNTYLLGELLPPPINSTADDISFVFEAGMRGGFFASNRKGGKGMMDVYHFKSYNLKIQTLVVDETTKHPIDYCEVKLLNNSITIGEAVTNGFGRADFQVGKNQQYTLIVNKEGYIQSNTKVQTVNNYNNDSTFTTITLKKDPNYKSIAPNDPLLANAINFRGKVLNYDAIPVPASIRMVNFQTGKMKIFDAESNGTFEVNLLSNSNYKIIIEYKDQHVEDEITTYGIKPGTVRSRTYNLNFNKSKITESIENDIDFNDATTDNTTKTTKNTKTTKTEQPKHTEQHKTNTVSSKPLTVNSVPTETDKPKDVPQKQTAPITTTPSNVPITTAPPVATTIPTAESQPKNTTQTPKATTLDNTTNPTPVAVNTAITSTSVVKPKTLSTDNAAKLIYKVQLGAYTDKSTDFSFLYGLGDIEIIPSSSGQYLFSLGSFTSVDDARVTLDKVRNKGLFTAFIVCYYNDEKVSIIR